MLIKPAINEDVNERARQLNAAPIRAVAEYVLYWCQMNRRADANQALDFAIDLANQLHLPVLVYEGLTYDHPYASDRFHRFVLEGVHETALRLAARGIGYLFYLRRGPSDPYDVLYRVAARAAAVVTDDYPTFIAARHNAGVAPKLQGGRDDEGTVFVLIPPSACEIRRGAARLALRVSFRPRALLCRRVRRI